MIPLGFIATGLGSFLAAKVTEKVISDRMRGPSPLVVVYASGNAMMARPFRNHGKAVEFQRALSAKHMASMLVLSDGHGNLSTQPLVAMGGLGYALISPAYAYALPKGVFSSRTLEPGKQGKGLIKVSEYDAQAYADEYGAHPPFETTETKDLYPPFYTQSYGSTYHQRTLPPDMYGSPFYGGTTEYNLVNTGNMSGNS